MGHSSGIAVHGDPAEHSTGEKGKMAFTYPVAIVQRTLWGVKCQPAEVRARLRHWWIRYMYSQVNLLGA